MSSSRAVQSTTPPHGIPPADRRVSGPALGRILGTWAHGPSSYAALADGLRRAVQDGDLPPRTRLPSERELAASLGVSRTTTAAAYQQLRDAGYIGTRRGSGSVVTLPGRTPGAGPTLAPADAGLVDLTIASPSAPAALQGAAEAALRALPGELHGHGYSPQGLLGLREAVAARCADRGTPTSPAEILVTSGAQHAISLILRTFVGPGDRVVVEQPTYPGALGAVRAVGARPVPVPHGPRGLDLDVLESTIRQTAPRLVYLVPDHHNPTGRSLDGADRARVRDLARRYRVLVVADETLADLALDGPPPPVLAGSQPPAEIVTVGSASKSFWGGLRVGWVRAHRDVVARLVASRPADDIATAVLDQLVVRELLADVDAVVGPRRVALRGRRDALFAAVAEAGLPWHAELPAGGMSAWFDLGAPLSSALAAIAPRHGVRVAPGPTFAADGGLDHRIRLTFSGSDGDIVAGVAGLAAAWRAVGGPAAGGTTTADEDAITAAGPAALDRAARTVL